MHQVRHRESRNRKDAGLSERDHAAVAGEEDQAGGRDSQPEGLGHDLAEDEAREDGGGAGQKQQQQTDRDPPLDLISPRSLRDRDGGSRAQAGRPNRPSGRTARMATTRTKMTRMA